MKCDERSVVDLLHPVRARVLDTRTYDPPTCRCRMSVLDRRSPTRSIGWHRIAVCCTPDRPATTAISNRHWTTPGWWTITTATMSRPPRSTTSASCGSTGRSSGLRKGRRGITSGLRIQELPYNPVSARRRRSPCR